MLNVTTHQLKVLDLVADGLSNKEIAWQLGLSYYTVKSYIHNARSQNSDTIPNTNFRVFLANLKFKGELVINPEYRHYKNY